MPGRLRAWFLACRPKTLPVSLSPVLVGTALAWHDAGQVLLLPLLAAALGAAGIQVGTNLFNDVGDFLRGTDTPERLGPRRATAEGWLTPRAVQLGAWLAFAFAFLCGIYLVAHGGWPIVVIGLASLAAGWAYTGGPRPIAYGPFGEGFVTLFFGLVAVGGSYYLQTLTLTADAVFAGLLLGLPAAAVITVNNHRDREGDTRGGRRTLAILLGPGGTRLLYAALLLLPYLLLALLPLLLPLLPSSGRRAWLPLLALPLAGRLVHRFWREPPGPALNAVLAATAGHQLLFAGLLALAALR